MKAFRVKILLTLLTFFISTQFLYAQHKINLILELKSPDGEVTIEKIQLKDSLLIDKNISQELNQLYFQGFLTAHVSEVEARSSEINVSIQQGELFKLSRLGIGNVDPIILDEVDFKSRYYSGKAFQFRKLEKLFERILNYTENHGYPFAIVKMDSIDIRDKDISAALRLEKGPRVVFDSLNVIGYEKLNISWLSSYLKVNSGKEFNQEIVENISSRMDELPFVSLMEAPIVRFTEKKATVILQLKENKINSIDGILGVFPNANEDSKLLITGSLDLHLFNLFSSAKELHLDWQKINVNSQTLDAAFYYPQFLKTPVGINIDFNLLKEDTVFLNNTFHFNLEFIPGKGQKMWFGSEIETSRTLGEEVPGMSDHPVFNDYSINYYGITYRLNRLNRRFLPTNGWYFKAYGSTGQKKLIKDNSVDESFYEGIELKSTQYKFQAEIDQYFNLNRGYVIRLRTMTGNIFGDYLFRNDLLRLGGLNSLRGFNENFFFVSNYALANLEFRIQNDAGTYFLLFYDQAVTRDKTREGDNIDYPFGTGLGLSFATNSGIFNFAFAVGKSSEQIFSLNSAKIHFGYTGRF